MKIFLVLFFILVSCISFAGDISEWPEGSAMHAGMAQNKILEKKKTIANKTVSKILDNLEKYKPHNGSYLSNLFKKHNENWIEYVNSTCATVGVMTGAGGSWPTYYGLQCITNMTDQRIFNLTNTLQCIRKHTENKRNYEISNCLYQSFTVEY